MSIEKATLRSRSRGAVYARCIYGEKAYHGNEETVDSSERINQMSE